MNRKDFATLIAIAAVTLVFIADWRIAIGMLVFIALITTENDKEIERRIVESETQLRHNVAIELDDIREEIEELRSQKDRSPSL